MTSHSIRSVECSKIGGGCPPGLQVEPEVQGAPSSNFATLYSTLHCRVESCQQFLNTWQMAILQALW